MHVKGIKTDDHGKMTLVDNETLLKDPVLHRLFKSAGLNPDNLGPGAIDHVVKFAQEQKLYEFYEAMVPEESRERKQKRRNRAATVVPPPPPPPPPPIAAPPLPLKIATKPKTLSPPIIKEESENGENETDNFDVDEPMSLVRELSRGIKLRPVSRDMDNFGRATVRKTELNDLLAVALKTFRQDLEESSDDEYDDEDGWTTKEERQQIREKKQKAKLEKERIDKEAKKAKARAKWKFVLETITENLAEEKEKEAELNRNKKEEVETVLETLLECPEEEEAEITPCSPNMENKTVKIETEKNIHNECEHNENSEENIDILFDNAKSKTEEKCTSEEKKGGNCNENDSEKFKTIGKLEYENCDTKVPSLQERMNNLTTKKCDPKPTAEEEVTVEQETKMPSLQERMNNLTEKKAPEESLKGSQEKDEDKVKLPSLMERMNNLEESKAKGKSTRAVSNEGAKMPSLQERMNNLTEKKMADDEPKSSSEELGEEKVKISLKDRMNNLEESKAKIKDTSAGLIEGSDMALQNKPPSLQERMSALADKTHQDEASKMSPKVKDRVFEGARRQSIRERIDSLPFSEKNDGKEEKS